MGSEKAPVSTTELSERAEELVRSVHDTGDAVVVLQGGEPAAVLIGATEFAALREPRRFLAAIGEEPADVNAGRVLTTQELKKSFEASDRSLGSRLVPTRTRGSGSNLRAHRRRQIGEPPIA